MKKRLISLLLVTVLMMTALSGCAGGTDKSSEDNSSTEIGANTTPVGEPTYGGSVVVGIQQDIDSLDPHKATAAGTKEILFNIFEGLVKPDENGNLIFIKKQEPMDGSYYIKSLKNRSISRLF